MAYWLLKTEPSAYSFDQLARDRRTAWDGIENPAALRNLRAAAAGDELVVYHTGDERSAVGTAVVVRTAYERDGGLAIDVEARDPLPVPVTLAVIKADAAFADSPLVRQGRLSVVPLTRAQWVRIQALARKKK